MDGDVVLDLDGLRRDLERVADRLRSMSDVRLGQPDASGRPRSAAALDLAQLLADAAAGVEARHQLQPPVSRVVPDLGVFALGDQVGVTGNDLVAALRGLRSSEEVWGPAGRMRARERLNEVAAAVRAVRLTL